MRVKEKKVATLVDRYESIDSFYRVITTRENNTCFGGRKDSENSDSGFTGTKSFEEAAELFRNGYDAGVKALGGKGGDFKAPAPKAITRNYYVGGCPNVARALQGLPDSMRQTYKVPQKQKVITLVYDACFAGHVNKSDIENAGKKLVSCIREIEKNGTRVALYVCAGNNFSARGSDNSGNKLLINLIKVKGSGEYLDAARLSFVLVHPSFLRRLCFKYWETTPLLDDKSDCCGYGHVGASFCPEDMRTALDGVGVLIFGKDAIKKSAEQLLDDIKSKAGCGK